MADGEFDEFVRSRSTGLLRIAYLLTGDRHAAEDLLQEVLEQMYVRWRRIRGAPEVYARRTLVNRSINRWRRRGRRPEAALGDLDVGLPDHSDGIVVRDVVVKALRELPPRQRAAVVLRYLDDRPVEEVAAALECSPGTVKSNAARGLEKLRAALGPVLVREGDER
ncbi:SigE family RNA polymerase sigma factor [Paractinoplanes ferrugineus]|uniref:RNA polymerase sigma24 factor n=1 Tax=Paractinoplanes ferrugineus TaxID=113564 RepID=A0A919ME06_9ACTN|nr:SigE family RNA polymerase sigma factor [Actinoplanes ferrugineus]GIE11134.1 RNA polymerase sigma24 factor [Actinoplanes ferrugineus]